MPRNTMSDSSLVSLLEDYLRRSDNGQDSAVAKNQRMATNYYLGRLDQRQPADAALSAQLGGDVADMVDAALAEFSQSYLGGEIAEFRAQGEEDRIAARVESAAVNAVIMQQQPGHAILQDAAQATMLYKDGIVAVEARELEVERSRFVGEVPDQQRAILEGQTGGKLDKDGILSWTEVQNRVLLRSVANENFFTDGDYPGWQLKEATFAAERLYMTRGALVSLGYPWDTVKNLKETTVLGASTYSDQVKERFPDRGERIVPNEEDEQELIETYICFVRLPAAGHKLRLYRVHMADRTILDKRPADFINYAKGNIIPFVGRSSGVSLFDRLKSVEDGTTFGYRQMEDNLAFGNVDELVLGQTANVDDAKARVPGGFIRSDVPTDVVQLQKQDLTSPVALYLQEMRTLRSERGGAQLDMANADRQLIKGNVGQDVGLGVLSAAEQRSAWYSANLAQTLLLQVFMLVHETMRRYQVDPVGVWVAGQFLEVDGRQFRERESANVRLGMSSGERSRRLRALDQNIMMQIQVAQIAGPGVLSTLDKLYTALAERDKLAGLEQEFWLDPQSPQSLQAQQANAQNAQQQQALAAQAAQAEAQQKEQELQLDKYKHDSELQFKYYDTNVDAGLKEAEITADNVIEMEKLNAQAQNQAGDGGGNGSQGSEGQRGAAD